MKKIALAAATLLVLSGAAFAENPNVGGQDINTIAQQQVDTTQTSSVGSATYKLLNAGGNATDTQSSDVEYRRTHFGNR